MVSPAELERRVKSWLESTRNLHITDLQGALALLGDLRERGAIAGFKPIS